jgi:hypothetical protein
MLPVIEAIVVKMVVEIAIVFQICFDCFRVQRPFLVSELRVDEVIVIVDVLSDKFGRTHAFFHFEVVPKCVAEL